MAIHPVLRLGDPRLLQTACSVHKFVTPALNSLITDLVDTMEAESGAGLAAPQIGVSLRVIIFGIDHNPRYPDKDSIPLTILINPVITPLSPEMEDDWEGCLSVPGMRGLVSRYHKIRYQGFDASGNKIDVVAEGFHARVVQHECDHLDGIIYTQRLCDVKKFGFTEELLRSGLMNEPDYQETSD